MEERRVSQRPRIQSRPIASYNAEVALRNFKYNLEVIKHKITTQQYEYLKNSTDSKDITDTIKVFLDEKYVVELDWLYSTFYTVTNVMVVRSKV